MKGRGLNRVSLYRGDVYRCNEHIPSHARVRSVFVDQAQETSDRL